MRVQLGLCARCRLNMGLFRTVIECWHCICLERLSFQILSLLGACLVHFGPCSDRQNPLGRGARDGVIPVGRMGDPLPVGLYQ